MSAVNIARLSEEPLHITVINDERPVGRGVAYGFEAAGIPAQCCGAEHVRIPARA